MQFVESWDDGGGGKREFQLEDVGSMGRRDGVGQVDRTNYESTYKSFVHTPHDSKR